MRFQSDEFFAGDFIGSVDGEAKVGFDGVELVSINWEEANFCRSDDPNGEPVDLTEADAESITEAIKDALAKVTDAGFGDLVIR
jgi:hypothetical protein